MAPQQTPEPIAIVGAACRFPGGASNPSKLWNLLKAPRDLCKNIPKDRFDTTGFYHPDGGHHGSTNVRQSYFLDEDVRVFDAPFFNISPNEADSIDPQQRLLMEAVYEALERGGHTLDELRGSDTAVYTGTMSVDYADTGARDLDVLPKYFATGTNRAIISNRISYVFDWHGPSMTIDTACSSSLIAVHQGVTALRTGESRVAVACGTQVLLNPETFIAESKLSMLSPTGHSRMWDADADGYARGEGVAAVILKKLSDAIADGDHIESIIRETGTNQDGRTSGITMPSTEAQAALIRQTYRKAGLDPENNPFDRPQYFEAHGTGTKAGDPREAAAIHDTFGRHLATEGNTPLYVGSVKTVIGHLEGSAGLAGLLKGSASIQNSSIAPNLMFNRLNPSIEQYYHGIKVPTALTQWPELPEGVPRRVSVNSFGFGGSNAHAILEQYVPSSPPAAAAASYTAGAIQAAAPSKQFVPFVFSAQTEPSLVSTLQAYSDYLKANPETDAANLSWTLSKRRTQFPIRASFAAASVEQLVAKLDAKLALVQEKPGSTLGVKAPPKQPALPAKLLGVFTGQGAQWAAMGAGLIRESDFVRERIEFLEASLASLPRAEDRPRWSLKAEMLAGADTSRIAEAALSQPLCTALQVALVDLLQSADITFSAVVGHSSGEIGAAYAAGFLSAGDAIRVAYYRGLYACLAGSSSGQKGAMMAVGTSWEDAQELVNLRVFRGRLAIAAHNSPASVTLSGDADALVHAKKIFDEEKKFARMLKVDTAYHSAHMLPCGDPYVEALANCGVRVRERNPTCNWYSSVVPSEKPMEAVPELAGEYWRDNMTNAVLFSDAVKNAMASDDEIALGLEVGPHPALKGPAAQNISEIRTNSLPYVGLLSRGQNDIDMFAEALGFIWTQLGAKAIDLQTFEKTALGSPKLQRELVVGLPGYQWNHGRQYWNESRKSRQLRERTTPGHELLGLRTADSNARDVRWTNVLKASEISWLSGHQLQGQTVFPAAGYIAMALEGSRSLAGARPVELFELNDLSIPKAIAFEDGDIHGVETLVTLTGIQNHKTRGAATRTTAQFSVYALQVSNVGSKSELDLVCSGSVNIVFGEPRLDALSCSPAQDYNMYPVDIERFYTSLSDLGYGYNGPFRTLSLARRRLGYLVGEIDSYTYPNPDSYQYLIHPSTLDVAFQASILAYSAPGDEHLWSLHVPTAIGSIRVNPEACASQPTAGAPVPVTSVLSNASEHFSGCIDILSEDGMFGMVQVEDLVLKPFAPATAADDRVMFTKTVFDVATPDGAAVAKGVSPSAREVELSLVCERLAFYYARQWTSKLTADEWSNGLPHFSHLRKWVDHVLATAASGKNRTIKKEWSNDGAGDIEALIARYGDEADVRLMAAVGENLPASVRDQQASIAEVMNQNGLLDSISKNGLGAEQYSTFLAEMVKQITHRYPHAKMLEIGGGNGAATEPVLDAVSQRMSSYTFTDASEKNLVPAQDKFKAYSDKMSFSALDIEKPPASQGFQANSFDIVIASKTVSTAHSLHTALTNARSLLKPGGYLVLLERTNPDVLRQGIVYGVLPSWWSGVEDKRVLSPVASLKDWNSTLKTTGFGGIDTVTPAVDNVTWPYSVMVSQAVDDRVQFLRRPLSSQSSASSVFIDSLVILGNASLETSRIAEELSDLLQPFCGEITVLESMPTEDDAMAMVPMSTFINLADVDMPVFSELTEDKMEGLKRVSDQAKHLLWITNGALAEQPYHMASITFTRVLRVEATHMSINTLDVADMTQADVSRSIAEHLLQLYALDEWGMGQEENPKLLWSKEHETFLENGKMRLPRIMNNVEQNARVNSARRQLARSVPVATSNLSLAPPSAPGAPASLLDIGPVAKTVSTQEQEEAVRVASSSIMALHMADDAFLYLGASHQGKVIVSTSNTSERVPVASVDMPNKTEIPSTDGLLVSVSSELLAETLVRHVPVGSSIVVHGSVQDRFLAAALVRRATSRSVTITFTYDEDMVDFNHDLSAWTALSARSPSHVIKKVLHLAAPTHFVDLTKAPYASFEDSSLLSRRISQNLPVGCKTIDSQLLSQSVSSLRLSGNQAVTAALKGRLADAVSAAVTYTEEQVKDVVVPLDEVSAASTTSFATTCAISWPADGVVKALVRPLNARNLFAKDKTYVLAGVSGPLGQSLCQFMVNSGAGCVVLTSRRPDIDPRWMASFEGSGAVVKVLPMDVTDLKSVETCAQEIRDTCPPIAGVAHGAMVLHDSLFNRMTTTKMQQIIGPKIAGANNLEAAFRDDALEFFIMFSSISSIVGNAGQSMYSAGNGYLNALARQRRRRGLAGSTFDIGRVVGVGYVELAAQIVRDQLIGLGVRAVSETDLRLAFAETIQAGYPEAGDKDVLPDAVVTLGVRNFHEDEQINGPWFTNPLFSHCIIKEKKVDAGAGDSSKKNSLPVGQQLAAATSKEEATDILLECFSDKLRVIIQLGDQVIDKDAPLIELGIDSLVAVEVRSWFLKELKVDIPVLKVVGGASPVELCESAYSKLPEDLLASMGKEGGAAPAKAEAKVDKAAAPAPAAAPAKATFKVEPKDSSAPSESSSVSGDNSTNPTNALFTPGPNTGVATPMSSAASDGSEEHIKDLKKPGATSASYFPPTAKRPAHRVLKSFPISFSQSRFWFLQQLLEDQRTHNVALYYHLTGNLQVNNLEKATRLVANRHESLRTSFVADENNAAAASQKVLASSPVRLECKTIESEDEVKTEYQKLRSEDFDMASGELLRLVLLTHTPTSHYLLMYNHHIIMDGVSLQIFLSDLEKAYKGQSLGPAPRQFPEFSAAQRKAYENGEMSKELSYWRTIFPEGDQPPVLPLLPMARVNSRAPMTKFDTHQIEFHPGPELAARVRATSKANRCTPFHFYLAAFKAMLFSFTDAQDLTIGIADASRNEDSLMASMGFYLNLLPLRFRRQAEQTFGDAMVEARNTSYAALETSRLPFDVLLSELNIKRDSSYSPFFQAFVDYRQGAQEVQPFGNCQLQFKELDTGKTAYDITLDVTDLSEDAYIFLRVQKALYDMTAAHLLRDTFLHFLDVLTAKPTTTQDSIPLFSEEQYLQGTQIGRGPEMGSDWPQTLPHRIDQVAQDHANKVAVMDGDGKSLTYADTINRIEAIAEMLRDTAGVGAGSRVLVYQQATADWPCSMLAIMRLGATYVPLDLRNPLPRLAAVAKDCEPQAILVDSTTVGDAPQLEVPAAIVIDVSSVGSSASKAVPNDAQADTPAAILYTSGSTGNPKGIVVTHAGLRNEIEGYTKRWELGAERVLQQSAFTFNHSSDQMYTGLTNGGMVYIVPWSKRGNPIEITQIMHEQHITYTKATPSEYMLWMQYGGDNLKLATSWRAAFGGGENFTNNVAQEFARLGLENLHVFNSYGPTEISISSTKMEIPYQSPQALEELETLGRIPCGYSLPNYDAYIVDDKMRALPAGMPGELCIGGAGVSRGYFKNEELTKKHFTTNPFATPDDVARGWTGLYRTSDVCHLNERGELVFHNRLAGDSQVKIRGLRIELSDIEQNIVAAAGGALNDAVVTLREGDPEFLVAHVVFAPNQDIADKEVYLERLLGNLPVPQYMIPVIAIPLDKLPLTNHSKVDRKSIQKMPLPKKTSNTNSQQQDGELSETMLQLRGAWQEVLGKGIENLGFEIGPSTNFFLVGGNSLLVIRLQQRIRQVLGVAVPLVDLLGASTLSQMARKVEESSVIQLTNWEQETTPPEIPAFLSSVKKDSADKAPGSKTIVMTGGTGYLAKHLLPQLIARSDVAKIHCIAVRDRADRTNPLVSSDKVQHHRGDLSSPLLGLSQDAFISLASQADLILHMGAARSFWDNYNVLRPTNVLATKEIIKLAAPRQVPVHYISTVGVLPRTTSTTTTTTAAATSASTFTPPTDGSNGYVATRWASERLLERSSSQASSSSSSSSSSLRVPSSIYRFLPAASPTPAAKDVLDEFVRCIDATKLMFDNGGWQGGRLDMIPAASAAQWMADSILVGGGGESGETKFSHYESPITVTMGELVTLLREQQAEFKELEQIPIMKWFGKIKAAGFGYFLASHDATVGGDMQSWR